MAERESPRTEAAAAGASGAASGFFDRGDRRTHLEQLRHLSQWSRRVLLVTGPRGVGKSSLYRQLSATLEPRAKAARLNGSRVSEPLEVLGAVVQGFGLAAPADGDAKVLRQVIADHAEAQESSERFCVTLIDDAELLDPRALEALIELASESPMRLVLFGEVRLVPAIERLAETRGVEWHEIRLTGFDLEDVRSYVEWRLAQQGHTGPLPFTDAQIREIARLSEGLPGRIDQMTNVLLARIQSAGHGPAGRRFPPLPDRHRIVLAALVLVLGFAWILWPSGDDAGPPAEVETLVLPSREAESPAPLTDSGAAAEAAASALTDAPEGPQDGTDGLPEAVAEPPAEAPVAEAEAVGSAQEAAPRAAAVDQPVAADPGPAESSGTEAARAPQAEAEPDAPQPAPVPDSGFAPQVRSAAWILQQPASAYTLQLASFSTAERAAEYLADQANPEDFARFRLQRDGRILHVVLYGRFDSRPEAVAASAALPQSVGRVEPWIRTFGQVQEAVRTALQP